MRVRKQAWVTATVLSIGTLSGGLANCSGADGPTSPTARDVRPGDAARREVHSDCQLDASTCSKIQDGINYLKKHSSEECKTIGAQAQSLFDMLPGVGGFRAGPEGNEYGMAVHMIPTPGQTTSGWSADEYYINVGTKMNQPGAWAPEVAGSLIGHEMQHMHGNDGPGHNTGEAQRVQDKCQSSSS